MKSRRNFIKKVSIGGIALGGLSNKIAGQSIIIEPLNIQKIIKYGPNDTIRLAIIGCGIQGFSNASAALSVEGIEIVAACDLYDGRLTRMKEVYGAHLFTTRDYRAVLQRSDIDAVCIATTDHWHDHITIAALEAGKAVYCEKPMMHHLEEGHAMIEAEKKYGLPVQIGSQRVSGIDTLKAKDLFESGIIGELNLADIRYDRNSALGAWQYSIPTDASEKTVDWKNYIGDAPASKFDPLRFFRWRNYRDYGTGVAGDLFVHLFSALHVITGSTGPNRIYATGGLRFWKDGRDVPDVTLGLYDYPESPTHPAFNVQMRVNFVDGSGGGSHVRLIGSEGVMTLGWRGITVQRSKVNTVPQYGGWDAYATFSEAQQKDFEKWYKAHYPTPKPIMREPAEVEYTVPEGYSSHHDHWWNFAEAVRNGSKLVEDTTFGMRAAGPALATNESYFERKIVSWDAITMKGKTV